MPELSLWSSSPWVKAPQTAAEHGGELWSASCPAQSLLSSRLCVLLSLRSSPLSNWPSPRLQAQQEEVVGQSGGRIKQPANTLLAENQESQGSSTSPSLHVEYCGHWTLINSLEVQRQHLTSHPEQQYPEVVSPCHHLHGKCSGFRPCACWTKVHSRADTPPLALNRPHGAEQATDPLGSGREQKAGQAGIGRFTNKLQKCFLFTYKSVSSGTEGYLCHTITAPTQSIQSICT